MSILWTPATQKKIQERLDKEAAELNSMGYCHCARGRARKRLDEANQPNGLMPDIVCTWCNGSGRYEETSAG